MSDLDNELVVGWLGNLRRDKLGIRVLDLALRASRKSVLPAPAHRPTNLASRRSTNDIKPTPPRLPGAF
jgi:hypothetical protein